MPEDKTRPRWPLLARLLRSDALQIACPNGTRELCPWECACTPDAILALLRTGEGLLCRDQRFPCPLAKNPHCVIRG